MLYNKRLRVANNLITLYDYEIPVIIRGDADEEEFKPTKEEVKQIKELTLEELEKKNYSLYKNMIDNLFKRQDRFIDSVNANLQGNCFMVTLTYNNDNYKGIDEITESNYQFTKFIKRYSYALEFKLKYKAVLELQKDKNEKNNFTARNCWHYHMIIFDFPTNKINVDELRSIWGMGAIHVRKVYKLTTGIGKYLMKYLLNDVKSLVSNKKSYFSSRNLIKPYIDYVIKFDEEKNCLITASGEYINLNDYEIEKEENYISKYTGETKKITFNKKSKR